jgi:hypothetical protein
MSSFSNKVNKTKKGIKIDRIVYVILKGFELLLSRSGIEVLTIPTIQRSIASCGAKE